MAAQFNGRNGTETLLRDVIVVLNIAAFWRQWVLRGEGFRSKYKPFGKWLGFVSWVNLTVLTPVWILSGFPLKFPLNLKIKQFQIFRISYAPKRDVISFISDHFPTIFPTTRRLWRLKHSDFKIPISQQYFVQFVWDFGICLFYA